MNGSDEQLELQVRGYHCPLVLPAQALTGGDMERHLVLFFGKQSRWWMKTVFTEIYGSCRSIGDERMETTSGQPMKPSRSEEEPGATMSEIW